MLPQLPSLSLNPDPCISAQSGPFNVEVLGFSEDERALFSSTFSLSARREKKFQEFKALRVGDQPDLYLVDGDNLNAMVELLARQPSSTRPAIIVGTDSLGTDWPSIERPIRWTKLFAEFDQAIDSAYQAKLILAHSNESFIGNLIPSKKASLLDIELPNPELTTPSQPDLTQLDMSQLDFSPDSTDFEKTMHQSQLNLKYRDAKTGSSSHPIASPREGVLIIDADARQRQLLMTQLVPFGLFVDSAENPEQALSMFDYKPYAVIIMTLEQSSFDAFQLCKQLKMRRSEPACAVVIITQKILSFDRMRAKLAGCDVFLSQPIDEDKLIAAIAGFLPQSIEERSLKT